ncbi:MAG TPA: ATP-binding protein [Candidatus Binataceae bacterium]|nr:ATP-binding protein [Candidatus Binataceae bacterium]
MGLRTKIAAIFVPLLVLAVLTVSATEIDHTMGVMVDSLGDSGSVLIEQTFEQIRITLGHAGGDPVASLRQDQSLAAFLSSSGAFGKGVVYARVETLDGQLIAGTSGDPVSASPPLPFKDLQRAVARWSPLARIRALWSDHVYEISSPVEINQRPFALIKVGLSTALLASEVRRSVADVLFIAAAVILMSLLGALLSGALLLAPVAAITAGVEQLAAGRDTGSLLIRGRDELSALARKFNELSHRVRSERVQWEDERGSFINIFRSIDDAVLLLDADGMVRFSSDDAQGRLGLPAGGLAQGKPLAELIGESHPLVSTARTARAAGTELRDVVIEEGRGKHKSRLLVSIFPLGADSARAGQLVIVRDLDPVQRLESVVDSSEHLARLGGLLSGVAHQIRNPLNAITLELELLRQDAQASRPVEDHVHAVREEMSRIDLVIEALMRFMRPGQLKTGRIAANDLMSEVAQSVNEPLIEVRCRLDPAAAFVNADHAVLMEALRNIVQNAIDAMPMGGTLTMASALVDGFVELSVSDTGQGIAPEHLNEIFQLYFTTKDNGNGVGLPLALRAVDLHGGTLDVQSKLNEGTSVRIRLPLEGSTLRPLAEARTN